MPAVEGRLVLVLERLGDRSFMLEDEWNWERYRAASEVVREVVGRSLRGRPRGLGGWSSLLEEMEVVEWVRGIIDSEGRVGAIWGTMSVVGVCGEERVLESAVGIGMSFVNRA